MKKKWKASTVLLAFALFILIAALAVMINIGGLIVFDFLFFFGLAMYGKISGKLETDNSKSSDSTDPPTKFYPLIFKVRDLTFDEFRERIQQLTHCSAIEDTKYYISVFQENKKQIEKEIISSQKCSYQKKEMIPLCVSFEDRRIVKELGAWWCQESKTWFWPFGKERSCIEKWLPLIYHQKLSFPYIFPMMVPKNLWGINLRSLLSQEQWDKMRKDTYKRFSYRCTVCGCKGQAWPVECDEMWHYDKNNVQSSYGTVVFCGVTALCPGCHAVKHFGKSIAEGRDKLAIARMCFLNKWNIEYAEQQIEGLFLLWEEQSKVGWNFDFSLLKKIYGVELLVNPVPPVFLRKLKSQVHIHD